MPNRMSETLCQNICQNARYCQIECQKIDAMHIYFQILCQKLCQDNGSGWDHSKNFFFFFFKYSISESKLGIEVN